MSCSVATMDSSRLQSTGVENRTIMRRFKSLKKGLLKFPRWLFGKFRPKSRQAPDNEQKTDDLDEGNNGNGLVATTVDDHEDNVDDSLVASARDDRGQSGDDGLAVEPEAAAESLPVDTYRALVKRGYTVNKRIGEGGYGSILLARSKRHHGQMAIKMVEKLSNGRIDSSLQWSIDNEITFAGLFDHPYLNVYHEIINTSRRLYIVMEYYPNGTLHDYLREVDHTPEPVAYEWFAQLCSALEYVHGCGYSHRDVKLDNVLLDRQRRIRLADFGLCGAASATVLNTTVCGTTVYMSPELLAREPYHGQSADVWAAGVLLYRLVTARLPFPFAELTDDMSDAFQRGASEDMASGIIDTIMTDGPRL